MHAYDHARNVLLLGFARMDAAHQVTECLTESQGRLGYACTADVHVGEIMYAHVRVRVSSNMRATSTSALLVLTRESSRRPHGIQRNLDSATSSGTCCPSSSLLDASLMTCPGVGRRATPATNDASTAVTSDPKCSITRQQMQKQHAENVTRSIRKQTRSIDCLQTVWVGR
jgi:hypothetical protein